MSIQDAYIEALKNKGLAKNKIKQFILAGKAIFTIKNEDTKKRFTYRVVKLAEEKKKIKEMQDLWFVNVLTGPENTKDYSYAGTLFNNLHYKHSLKAKIGEDAQSIIVFKWFLQHLSHNSVPEFISVYHEGKCARCGKILTVPESIESGYGPECITLI